MRIVLGASFQRRMEGISGSAQIGGLTEGGAWIGSASGALPHWRPNEIDLSFRIMGSCGIPTATAGAATGSRIAVPDDLMEVRSPSPKIGPVRRTPPGGAGRAEGSEQGLRGRRTFSDSHMSTALRV